MTDQTPETCSLVTRREFVKGMGATFAAVTAAGYGISIWGRNPAYAAPAPRAGTFDYKPGRVLVVIEMGGGNDALNMVIPHADPAYYDARPELALPKVKPIDDEIGFHPVLEKLAERWAAGNVAIVEGVGYPNSELSHFAAQADWWSGDPGAANSTGWLGRWLDGAVGAHDPLAAIAIGQGPARALVGDTSFTVAIQDASGLAPSWPAWIDSREELLAAWSGFGDSPVDSPELFGKVQRAIGATSSARDRLKLAFGPQPPGGQAASAAGLMEMEMPKPGETALRDSLDVAAQLILSEHVSPAVIYVHGFSDYDTHTGQSFRHRQMMMDLDAGLEQFFTTIEAAGIADDIIVVTTSEFGRRVASNGTGTDHGTSGDLLVIGKPVTGGRYGERPSLTNLDERGNMFHTVDFRSVYATLLDRWFDAPHPEILGGRYETFGLLPRPVEAHRASRSRPGG